MFEEMTYESILEQMLSNIPDGLSKSEGSLIYNACAKQAVRLEEAYQQLHYLERNMYTDTADLEHLIMDGNERGIIINYATFAEFKAQFNCKMDSGDILTYDDLNYTVFTCLDEGQHIYLIGCNEEGAEPNTIFCELSPVEYKENYEWGRIIELVTPGKDIENVEAYRQRLLSNYSIKSFAGNRAYYQYCITLMEGVGNIKIQRRVKGEVDIKITIIGSDYNVPSDEIIDAVQNAVDPRHDAGEGVGIAPIGHMVTILPVAETTCCISTTIVYEEGYTYDDLKTQIESAVDGYLLDLRKKWQETDNTIVRILQVESRIAAITGVIDVSDTTINGAAANLNVGNTIPIKGEIICS